MLGFIKLLHVKEFLNYLNSFRGFFKTAIFAVEFDIETQLFNRLNLGCMKSHVHREEERPPPQYEGGKNYLTKKGANSLKAKGVNSLKERGANSLNKKVASFLNRKGTPPF